MTIGLVMIVKNESRSLRKCLARAKKLVDEIYITDTGSTDDTVKIAEEFGAHITTYEWGNDFEFSEAVDNSIDFVSFHVI